MKHAALRFWSLLDQTKQGLITACILCIAVIIGLIIIDPQTSPMTYAATTNCASVTSIPTAECQALIDIYDDMGGLSWHTDYSNGVAGVSSGWDTNTNPCTWHGVTCSNGTTGNVTRLDFDGDTTATICPNNTNNAAGLTGSVPPSFSGLSLLTQLSLSNNIFDTNSLAPVNQALTDLCLINIDDAPTPLDISFLTTWGPSMTQLRNFHISSNNISDLSPLSGWAEYMTGLEFLYINNNNISDLSPLSGWGPFLTDLNWVTFSWNNISDLSPLSGWASSMTSLWYLDLSSNAISDLSPLSGWGSFLTNLTYVFLGGNNISDITPLGDWGPSMTNLSNLTLGYNLITSIAPLTGRAQYITNLDHLYLNDNSITDINLLDTWGPYTTDLSSLYFDNNTYTGAYINTVFSGAFDESFNYLYIDGTNALCGEIPTQIVDVWNSYFSGEQSRTDLDDILPLNGSGAINGTIRQHGGGDFYCPDGVFCNSNADCSSNSCVANVCTSIGGGGTGDFVTTWDTTNPGISNSTSIMIPTHPSETYNYDVDWDNDGIFDTFGLTGDVIHDFGVGGIYTIRISGTFPAIYFNNTGDRQKILSVDQWGTGLWQTMNSAFYGATNVAILASDTPDLSSVTSMFRTFFNTSNFNQDISNWDVSTVTNFNETFRGSSYNQPLNTWNTSSATSMEYMFLSATGFNQDISSWNVSNVSNMYGMFEQALAFNQPLNSWDVSNATTIGSMFQGATSFNQPLNSWNTSNVTDMYGTFYNASNFNQDISTWNTSNVTDMSYMFQGATNFNQPLNSWNTNNVNNMSNMLNNTALSSTNYDNALINWDSQVVQTGITLGAQGLTYCNGSGARANLISSDAWTIIGDSLDCGAGGGGTGDDLSVTNITLYSTIDSSDLTNDLDVLDIWDVIPTVYNNGTGTINFDSSITYSVTYSGTFLGTGVCVPSGTLNPGQSLDCDALAGGGFTGDLGTATIEVMIDYDDVISETNESNNTYNEQYTFTSGATGGSGGSGDSSGGGGGQVSSIAGNIARSRSYGDNVVTSDTFVPANGTDTAKRDPTKRLQVISLLQARKQNMQGWPTHPYTQPAILFGDEVELLVQAGVMNTSTQTFLELMQDMLEKNTHREQLTIILNVSKSLYTESSISLAQRGLDKQQIAEVIYYVVLKYLVNSVPSIDRTTQVFIDTEQDREEDEELDALIEEIFDI